MAIRIVRQSVMVSLPIAKQTAIIMATEATFTASKNAEKPTEFRIRFINGLSRATNTNEGRKIPTVEMTAPPMPLI